MATVAATTTRAGVKARVKFCQRVAQIVTGPDVAPTQTQAPIKITCAFTGNHILTREDTRATDIRNTHGELRQAVILLQKAQLEVNALIGQGSSASFISRSVKLIGDVAVAETHTQGVKGLHKDVIAAVGTNKTVVKPKLALRCHASRWGLHHTNQPPIVGGKGQISLSLE